MVKASGVILAGGKSRRMGEDKALLSIGKEEMIGRVALVLKRVFPEVLVCGGCEKTGSRLGLRVVQDIIKGGGPLCGIHAALHSISHDRCLVVACDMPFISAPMAAFMVEQSAGYDVAVPRRGEFLEPLFAVYAKSCLPAVEEQLSAGCRKVTGFFPKVRVKFLDEEELRAFADPEVAFFNVNTPRDLQKAREMTRSALLPESGGAGT